MATATVAVVMVICWLWRCSHWCYGRLSGCVDSFRILGIAMEGVFGLAARTDHVAREGLGRRSALAAGATRALTEQRRRRSNMH